MASAPHARDQEAALSQAPHGLSPPPPGARCLVLGAGGFIGTNLCLALDHARIPTTGFGRAARVPQGLAELDRLDWRHGTIEMLSDPERLVAGHTHLFDLIGAGLPNSSNDNPAQAVADGLPLKVRLLEACRREGVQRTVFTSSGGTVYGPAGNVPILETAPTNPICAYGIGKLTVEKYLALYRHLHGLDYRVLRIANAYGEHQRPERGQGLVAAVLDRLLTGMPIPVWGDGATVRDYLHIDDVVAAILAAAFSDADGARLYNVGSGIGRSVRAVIDDAARVTGLQPKLAITAARSADVAVNILDSGLLRRETGWTPVVAWEDGLARTAAWLLGRDRMPGT
ncbi:NAD-dependent epimerase/dehydratase family protein [Lichenicola cladoniae]|uniref:NAD-dependent epimerase/dehydratase family protein n=1 Tax=Lichenicola cladoniae TaxID=1484109 RepID=A0A6M8HSH5_9PROT|nr:NAD-dependent epimerase/dehydratase family protein [Lichenicola cladoniae]NPD65494.1 NAD-dependent epimerase/dehydratase family protein [Acetobacteraceae bacterium]QKE91444.1 NAD-dependent epimerase/dehydratase family protein [Lichenicola cladoniae]